MNSETPFLDALFRELASVTSVLTDIEHKQDQKIADLQQAAKELLEALPPHCSWGGDNPLPYQRAAMKLKALL